MKKKVFALLPDGVGVRNYLYSEVFKTNEFELTLMHTFDSKTLEVIGEEVKFQSAIKLPNYKESVAEKFLRELICLSRLHHNARHLDNPTILSTWRKNHSKPALKVFYRAVEFGARWIKRYDAILNLERRYQKALRKNVFYRQTRDILERSRPAMLLCLHQRGLQMPTVFAAARDLGIPTATVIFSWDNLPKARMALWADKYFVWSEHMKREMALFYPEIPQEKVFVTGTPQFEFYADPSRLIDKKKFFEKYALDPNKKIICFSGDDVLTSPDDPKYLQDIAQAIVDHGLASQWQILLRRCPVDFSGRFDKVVSAYDGLIKVAEPLWYSAQGGWTSTFAKMEDVDLLVSTAYYSDVVVNVGSTMAFDFAMFKKPAVFINYDQADKHNPNWSVETIYRFQHFRSMPDKTAVFWLNGANEIVDTMALALTSGENKSMEAWKAKVIGDFEVASKNIKALLNDTIFGLS
ncbi:hypothetical protein [Flavobacterium caeni]|uniref:CDP-Glycerol:Poly(Glycerophosphate) glycerophosphotransferase n=1 Tax=Flavobacterium caeni TaxID=490189 RepID=A0A1G5FN38_9FLAO|nr:hypothetical protein [Flavobacterium caeni]SCY40018.1 hypothetical protein SAMN02927903_01329 [Flavobacterium caeni]